MEESDLPEQDDAVPTDVFWEELQLWSGDPKISGRASDLRKSRLNSRLVDSLPWLEKLALAAKTSTEASLRLSSGRQIASKIWAVKTGVICLGDVATTKIPTGFISPTWVVSALITVGISNHDPVELENTSLLGCLDSTIPPGTPLALRYGTYDRAEMITFTSVSEDHLICRNATRAEMWVPESQISEIHVL